MKWKLDNKGWGFATFIIYLSIFIAFIIVVSILALRDANEIKPQTSEAENVDEVNTNPNSDINNENKDEDQISKEDYTAIEEDLENAAYQYQKEYLTNMHNGDVEYVTATKLEELKILDNLTNGDVLCSGYAKITYNNGQNDVMAFINCGDYITEGYNEDLDK